jgi:L-aspartate oxidase
MNGDLPRAAYTCDVLVIGGGAAGLASALRLAAHRNVILMCKTPLGSGAATAWAQGGIAAALGEDDSPDLHVTDTERVGGGLNDHRVVEILARDAGMRIAELIALGASFDREPDGALALGREAAHSRRRILHAGGDATGREVLRALVGAIGASSVRVIEAQAHDIRSDRGRVTGVNISRPIAGGARTEYLRIDASAIVLATGGCGRVFQYTTNPAESTGDGLAMAARVGAELADLEFVQFHPTALAAGLDPMPLLTEALRGEGARLTDAYGTFLMDGVDPRGDLAPRDVVARIIFQALAAGNGAFLDARAIPNFATRFPTVWAESQSQGLDPRRDLLPIAPAAHYHMGGIAVDQYGRASLKGLWACGEVASTGAHGANRLASNSLLEALVFGARVADDILAHTPRHPRAVSAVSHDAVHVIDTPPPDNFERLAKIRKLMYDYVGLVRDDDGLRHVLGELDKLDIGGGYGSQVAATDNILCVAKLISQSALDRRESRGSHFRRDYPELDPALAHRTHGRARFAKVAAFEAPCNE